MQPEERFYFSHCNGEEQQRVGADNGQADVHRITRKPSAEISARQPNEREAYCIDMEKVISELPHETLARRRFNQRLMTEKEGGNPT